MPKKRELTRELKKQEKTVPQLPDDMDYDHLFGTGNTTDRKKFADLVEDNITDAKFGKALDEKKAGLPNLQGKNKRPQTPQAFLDLHGFTALEAERETQHFITQAAQQGMLCVCIITGKGLHSQGEGVLRNTIEAQLMGLKKNKDIASYRWEKKTKQKSGAIIVFLH